MKSSKRTVVAKDPKKETLFKSLCAKFEAAGLTVRREKLKQGPGWKVVSGACRANNQRLVFVDPRLAQDDQILFLRSRAKTLGIEIEGGIEGDDTPATVQTAA